MKGQLNLWIFIFRRFYWKIRSYVEINTCYLFKKNSSFVFHWTITATAATIIHLYILHLTSMASDGNIFDTPPKNKHGKLLVSTKKKNSLSKLSMSPSTPSTVSSRSSIDVLSSSLPSWSPLSLSSSLSVVSQTKKRLHLSNDEKPQKKTPKEPQTKTTKEPRLAAYDIDWFDLTATKNECLKHLSIKNLPST